MQSTKNTVLILLSIFLFAIAGVFIYLSIQEKAARDQQSSQKSFSENETEPGKNLPKDEEMESQIKTYQELKSESKDTFQAGWEAAEKRLAALGFTPSSEEEITSVSGEIISTGNNQVKINTDSVSPLADKTRLERTAKITDETSIYKLTENPEAFNEENFEENQNPPEPFNRSEASLQDLKEGRYITVLANEDIREKTQLTAAEIEFEVFEEKPANKENAMEESSTDQVPAPEEENSNQEQGEQIQQEEIDEAVNQE
ncbi:MAG: hypothetical protein R6V40_02620 [Candidatus Moraniibacteriota bacterium]